MVSHRNNQRKVHLAEPDQGRRPHPMASEVTEQEFRKTGEERNENSAAARTVGNAQPVSRAQRKVGRYLAGYGLLVLGIAVIITMIIMGTWNWGLFALGLAILFCYMIFISAPFWLASSTKVAQDEAAKDVVDDQPERTDRAPELRDRMS